MSGVGLCGKCLYEVRSTRLDRYEKAQASLKQLRTCIAPRCARRPHETELPETGEGKVAGAAGGADQSGGDLRRTFVVSMVWGKSYLFVAPNEAERRSWVGRIQVTFPVFLL